MKKSLKRMISAVVSAAMIISSLTVMNVTANAAEMSLTGAGWFESVYAEWLPVDGVAYYEAEIKSSGAADTEYETVDDELIRQYDKFNRVDVVGLKAGSYDLKVTAYDESGAAIASDTKTYEAKAYDRSGAAFSTKNNLTSAGNYSTEGVGAYKMDGTLKDGAKVFYVTPETAKTIKTEVVTSSKGATTTGEGIQTIIDLYQKGFDKTPIDFRIVGLISKDDLDHISSSKEGLQIKGKSTYSQLNITIEGIGNDAAVTGFGFLLRNAAGVEIRNIALLNFMDDGISIDTANSNLWIHNNDLFYGGPGGDSDQAKGDGSVDVKAKSTNVTVSYNHFWDSGKSSLCGMGEETADSLITYHHNWFDHSDSRHPRVRAMSVHIYNNYYDGNAKYGSASANDASLFVQNNYYRSCKFPVIIGGQGHEIGSEGKGTLSGEKGSPIKLSGNIMTGTYSYTDYTDSTTNFDGVKVDSASKKLGSEIKAVDGSSYNNFDTDTSKFDLAVKDLDEASAVPAKVMANAGRCQGGDIFHSFDQPTDDTNYSVNSVLKNKVIGYTSSVKVVGGTVKAGATNPGNTDAKDPSTTDPDYNDRDENNQGNAGKLPGEDQGSTGDTPGGTVTPVEPDDGNDPSAPDEPTPDLPSDDEEPDNPVEGNLIWDLTNGTNTLNAVVNGKEWSNAKDNPVTYDGKSLTKAIKMESSTTFEFSTGAAGKLTIVSFVESGLGKDGVIKLDGNNVTLDKSGITTVDLAAGNHKIQKNTTKTHIYYLAAALGGGTTSPTDPTDPPVTEPSYEGTTLEISEVVTENTDGKDSPNITYPKNADGSYSIDDKDTALTGNLIFPFEPQSKGKVVISGTFTPGGTNSGWTLVQIVGKETADAAELSDLFDFRAVSDKDISDNGAIGSKGNYNLRIGGGYKAGLDASISTSKTEYQFVIDLTNKTVKATIGGKSTEEIPFDDVSVDSISGVKFMTASGERTITMSVPEVLIVNEGEPVDPDPDNPDKPDPDDPDKPDPDKPVITADGDADNNGALTANDAAVALLLSNQADFAAAKTLADSKNWSAEKADVDGNGQITMDDISRIMAKVLDSSKAFTKA